MCLAESLSVRYSLALKDLQPPSLTNAFFSSHSRCCISGVHCFTCGTLPRDLSPAVLSSHRSSLYCSFLGGWQGKRIAATLGPSAWDSVDRQHRGSFALCVVLRRQGSALCIVQQQAAVIFQTPFSFDSNHVGAAYFLKSSALA